MHGLRFWFVPLTAISFFVAGCGPAVPREELGEVQFTLPPLPGTDKPYPIPELEQPATSEADDEAASPEGGT